MKQEIVYFGEKFSFSHIAAEKRFGKNANYHSKRTIRETLESAMTNHNLLAVVPVENTTGGVIYDTIDFLSTGEYLKSELTIIEQLELAIKLYLMSKSKIKLNEVKKIYSNEYALRRSSNWTRENLPDDIELHSVHSTSEAASKIKHEKGVCAIASIEAAKYYGLDILAKINPKKSVRNITRFLVIGYSENGLE